MGTEKAKQAENKPIIDSRNKIKVGFLMILLSKRLINTIIKISVQRIHQLTFEISACLYCENVMGLENKAQCLRERSRDDASNLKAKRDLCKYLLCLDI